MRVKSLDIGVESITRWQLDDEVHLPKESSRAGMFLPQYRALDEILRRPSLDERVPRLLQPDFLDPDLMEPAALSEARIQTRELFLTAARRMTGQKKALLDLAAETLDEDVVLDDEIRRSLAALLRG